MDVRGTIILAIIPVLLILTVNPPDVHGVTRSEIHHMKTQVNELRDDIESLNPSIESQRNKVNLLKSNLEVYKNDERRANEWDRLTKTTESRDNAINAYQKVKNTETQIKNETDKLESLISKKNAINHTIQQLEKKIKSDELLLKKNSKILLQGLTRVIGVEISKTCQTMIIHSFETDCPSYRELQSLDNSLLASGEFKEINGFYQRDKPLYNNDHVLYDFETDFVIIVNPSGNIASRIKMITIESNMDTYLTAFDMKKIDDTRTLNHDRWVDSCKNAVINSSNWKFLLPDTIHYLRTGCTVTAFDSIEVIEDKITEVDLTTSPNYQAKWKHEADVIKCKGLCFEY